MPNGGSMVVNADSDTGTHSLKKQPLARFSSHFFSIIFHPLFIPVYVTWFLLFWHPIIFINFSFIDKIKFIAIIIFNLTFLPAITVFLAWRLKFVSSIYLGTQKERIIPYAAAMVFYFWCWYVVRNFAQVPIAMKDFLLGSFITVIAAWLINIYSKVSMHGLATGGMALFVLIVTLENDGASGQYVSAAFLISGIVISSRLIVSDHSQRQIYGGFFVGVFCQLLAMWM